MLDSDYLYRCTDNISALYAELELSIITDISRRVSKTAKITESAKYQIAKAQQAGAVYGFVITEVSRLTGLSTKEVKRLFQEAGAKSVAYDNRVYTEAGVDPIVLTQSKASMQVLIAGMVKTNLHLKNLTMTTALTAQSQFIKASDRAYMQIASGAFDYNSAIKSAVKGLAAEGITMVDYATGRTDHIDVAVRRATLTGVNQTCLKITELGMKERGVELVQTSQHWGARPEHELWQGKIYSLT